MSGLQFRVIGEQDDRTWFVTGDVLLSTKPTPRPKLNRVTFIHWGAPIVVRDLDGTKLGEISQPLYSLETRQDCYNDFVVATLPAFWIPSEEITGPAIGDVLELAEGGSNGW